MVTTRRGNWYLLSAPAKPSKINNSLLFISSFTAASKTLKESSLSGRLISPQSIRFSLSLFLTINLSLGDLPVYIPVFTITVPFSDSLPSPLSSSCSLHSSCERLQYIADGLMPICFNC